MAARPRRAHAPAVPLRYDPDGDGPVQPGLPGVLAEEAPLPSEVVMHDGMEALAVDGSILARRRREALAAHRGLLLERPEEFSPAEWRVVQATLAPPQAHLGRAPGSRAHLMGVTQAARDCFPGLPASTAVRRFRETQRLPHVAAYVADFRALEMLDVQEQRGMLREAYHMTIARGTAAIHAIDPVAAPREWASVSLAVTAACKAIADMDALALRAEDVAALTTTATSKDDDAAGLSDKVAAVARVAEDLKRRRPVSETC